MSGRQAIVTLAVGPEFAARWRRHCDRNWRRYAERHGYELICIEEPLDRSERARSRSPSWQKLLVLGQPFASEYERIVWVDSDVVFADQAPAITEGVPTELVGAVNELSVPPRIRPVVNPETTEEYYGEAGLPDSFEQVVQAGVMVLSPLHHRELLEDVYNSYEGPGPGLYYEMRPLSYELLRRDLVSWLDPRFNVLWSHYQAQRYLFLLEHPKHPRVPEAAERALGEVYCLHFAGQAEQMDLALERVTGGRGRSDRRAASPARARSAVILFLYRRRRTAARVLEAIRQARPSRLLVAADGPRADTPDEAEECERTRELIESVDWDCEISTDYAERNLGAKRRIETGLDWAFSQVEEAIVLEDDCVPDPSFFGFCAELLERYRDDERVMSISGNNFQFDGPASGDSYYFSRYSQVWGWATWRRAWSHYDPAMAAWPSLRDSDWLRSIVDGPYAAAYWSCLLDQTYRDHNHWDRAWRLACWLRDGLHAIPNVNLVSNVGFPNDGASSRPEFGELLADLPTEQISFPLAHPRELRANAAADAYLERVAFSGTLAHVFRRLRHTQRIKEAT